MEAIFSELMLIKNILPYVVYIKDIDHHNQIHLYL